MKGFPVKRASNEVHERIEALREYFGKNLVIVGHHYQSDDVVRHVDRVGDSLELARMMGSIEAEHVVFCGVHFMAESAALLARPGQKVYLPAKEASCVMANMTPAHLLEKVYERISGASLKILPLAYVNTSLAVKAVVGRHGGAVCTSANADKMMRWALDNSDVVFFLPDKNLGMNTAKKMAIPADRCQQVDVSDDGAHARLDDKTRLLLWPGCCPIHACFTAELAAEARRRDPGCRVLVHPECSPSIVDVADGAGSTSYLIKQAAAAQEGEVLYIGTESNLVHRLIDRYAGKVQIKTLTESTCANMLKVDAEALLRTLEGIRRGDAPVTRLKNEMIEPARASLQRMLDYCAR